ncbi:metallophosphoesterase [Spirosoma sp. KCTC 42546]|uniref:metallophosphoesterase family protein n=1 Tax=Spirosoma sp. KCTC 42546 TaxID=2520506 RepID=UPI001159D750|nr:metallophosphoesterase [Spirosoma sp. KCTC 42546]QDK81608.1 metallophosphoesterase [Spirosoma sp. KCTC 42546]
MVFTEKFAINLEDQRNQLNLAQALGLNLGLGFDPSIWSFLKDSERQLIQLMDGPTPPEPDASGNIEFGWCLYFLNGMMPNVPPLIQSSLQGIKLILTSIGGMPTSRITSAQWKRWLIQLDSAGVLKGDGTLVSTARYALIDPGWALSLLNFLSLKLGIRKIVPFNPVGKTIQVTRPTPLRMALFGDWGTGPYLDGNLAASPSQLVMQQIQKKAPDMAVHLGDVYYSGMDVEEHLRLVDSWTYKAPLGNFTLNSNHEMYYGGHGLFNIALNPASTPLFQAQGSSTFFSVSFGNWLILGLDSAYNAPQRNMYLDGAITDPAQKKLLKDAGTSGKKIMIFTHHNPINETGTIQNNLWNNVVSALGKNPDYWYWGHVHNGIVYSEKSAAGSVKCRCQGNSAIPIGHASWYDTNANISFYTNSPLGDTDPRNALRIKNGFALLEFGQDTVKETWYYQDGTLAWSS